MNEVRKARYDDLDAVFTLALDFPSPIDIDKITFSETWSSKLEDKNSFVGVAEQDDRIVGYAAGCMHIPFYANGPIFWLDEIFLKEEFRGSGLGKYLMEQISAWAKDQGCIQLLLASSKAGDFYEPLGFKPTAIFFKKHL